MKAIINLTQHHASPSQIEAGVVEPGDKEEVKWLLSFEELPTAELIIERSGYLADIAVMEAQAHGTDQVMIGGASWLMGQLECDLAERGLQPVHAFSQRVSVDQAMDDGSIQKVSVFQHVGFVPALVAPEYSIDLGPASAVEEPAPAPTGPRMGM